MNTFSLKISTSGPDYRAIAESLREEGLIASAPPLSLEVDDAKRPAGPDWVERWIPAAKRDAFAVWDRSYECFAQYVKGSILKTSDPKAPRDIARIKRALEQTPLLLAAFAPVYEDWLEPSGKTYRPPSFGDLHFPLGWGCAFRGAGHQRLVSRRWLEFGPWRLIRGANDLSLVQFHDLDASAAEALEQAEPGHQRMGISETGGFLQTNFVYRHKIDGLYLPAERKLRILVNGREITQLEMLEACAVRQYQTLGPDSPIDSIAYVFAVAQEARAHLHELWLRELECWTFADGGERRLDSDYHPVPQKPAWVKRLDDHA